MTLPFHALLTKLLDRNGAPMRKDFADLSGLKKSHVTEICKGHRTPPPDKIEAMIAGLGLSQAEATEFRLAATEAHIPSSLRKNLTDLMLERADAIAPLVRSLRLRLAARHAREIGKPVSVEEIAKETGLDPYHLDRALASWHDPDDGKSRAAVAQALDVEQEWITTGRNDPDWYKNYFRVVDLPSDPEWTYERKRIIG